MGLFDKLKSVFVNKKDTNLYEKGLTKSRNNFVSKLTNLNDKYKEICEDYFDELEEILIGADIGINTLESFMESIRKRVIDEKIKDTSLLKEIIVDELFVLYVNDNVLTNKINYNDVGPTVLLFVGVNGVGKTTTIGKLASKFKKEGKKVLLIAGDTFRAGATEQLEEWSKRSGVDFYGVEDRDPASVIYDGLEKAKRDNFDIVLVDTAGRLQNKDNLMRELEKINKVIST